MTDFAAWMRANDEYLGTSVAWLRDRLERLGGSDRRPVITWTSGTVPRRSWLDRLLGRSAPVIPVHVPEPRLSLPAGDDQREMTEAIARFEAAESPPALVILARRLGLTRFERDVLLLAAAMELDTRIPALCARAQNDPSRPYPTFALAMALFDAPEWDVLSPERPLRWWRLLEITTAGLQPLTASALRADERVVNFLKGLNHLDERFGTLVTPLVPAATSVPLAPSHAAAVARGVEAFRVRTEGEPLPRVDLVGPDLATLELVGATLADALSRQLHRIGAEAIPGAAADAESLARLWDREATLLPVALFIDATGQDGALGEATLAQVDAFTARLHTPVLVGLRDPRPGRRGASVSIDVGRPTSAEQRDLWGQLVGDGLAARLAGQFDLSQPAIERIAAASLAAGPAETAADRLWAGCLAATRPRLEHLAQRIDVRTGWDDLVLPPEQLATLHQVVAQVAQRHRVYEEWGFGARMNRGLGISVLFTGESGTGKTMAAEIIARALELDLYRIDLSAVVSKYIGETEKNLRRVFDAAEEGGAILLFDEADALFGKRSEVKDSHDRYANIEINYLLQRLEGYRGLAILTSNMRTALDRAFLRRLRFVVDFPVPGLAERRRLWAHAFPPSASLGDVDLDRLARLTLTGGSIQTIALNAAFAAAHAGEPIGMARVLAAARLEYRKLERPINEADFRWLSSAGEVA